MNRHLLPCLLLTLLAAPAFGALQTVGIAAVVDDQVISTVDLNDRVALTMGLTGIPDTPENRAKLVPQILHQLIDEKLEMEEAAKENITLTDARINEGVEMLEKQNNKPSGALLGFIQSHGLSKISFLAQVKAELAWSEVIRKKVRPKVRISDQEIARASTHAAANEGHTQEVQISSIQLPIDSPEAEPAVKKAADQLASQIRAGASFDAVAAQFSPSAGGPKAGEPFWVSTAQLDPQIAAAVAKLSKGQITDPIRTAAGYQVIKLMDTREAQGGSNTASVPRAELAFKQILMTLKADASRKEAELLLKLAQEAAVNPGKCTEMKMAGVGDLADFDFKVELVRSVAGKLPDKLRDILMKMPVSGVSPPIITPQGIRIFQLCERIDLPPEQVSEQSESDTVRQSLFTQKIELEAQKYLLNLRREAFIEMRLH